VFEDSAKIFPKTLSVLYSGGPADCQNAFRDYVTNVITSGDDPAFLNFIKVILADFKSSYPEEFAKSNLGNIS
jgi:hypothetical protein